MTDDEQPRVICLPNAAGNPGGFDDDIYGNCVECNVEIHWRPHAPAGEKICLPCYLKLAKPDDEIKITPMVVNEFIAWLATQKKKP